ncbi:MAG: Anaerobic sulfatase-maturating enzyme-like protein, partial [Elusimicrobia bacterium]
GVELCVPLDGPADLHDRRRAWSEGSSHAAVERWLRAMAARHPGAPRPRAWLSVTNDSLGRAQDIVAEYARLGLEELHPRPLWPAVSAAEYRGFYAECLDRLLAPGGPPLRERTAAALLTKILRGADPGFVELRSPYGGGLGELAYDVDGEVYLSDEGRRHGLEAGRSLFKIGTVDTPYRDVAGHAAVRACAAASDLEAQPMCSSCAYKPFCGVSPVYNLAAQGTIWGRNPTNDRCAQYMGVFDLLFKRLRDPEARAVLERWAEASPYEPGQPPPAFLSAGVL